MVVASPADIVEKIIEAVFNTNTSSHHNHHCHLHINIPAIIIIIIIIIALTSIVSPGFYSALHCASSDIGGQVVVGLPVNWEWGKLLCLDHYDLHDYDLSNICINHYDNNHDNHHHYDHPNLSPHHECIHRPFHMDPLFLHPEQNKYSMVE